MNSWLYLLIVLNKSEIFGILIQSKTFFQQSGPILIRQTCRNIWSNPVYIRKNLWLRIILQWSMQFGYPYHIRLSFFKIQSNPDPVLKCRSRLDHDPETGSCSTLFANGDDESDLVGWSLLCSLPRFASLPLGSSDRNTRLHRGWMSSVKTTGKLLERF